MFRVLIAEDEWLVAYTLREQLEQQKCKVVGIAKTGEQTLELCRSERPDVVLVDITMPSTDGIEATRRIMQECPTCVIVVTAHGQPHHVLRAEEAGAMAYLLKPVSGAQILPAIKLATRRFAEFKSLQEQGADLQRALETRRLVERAKGILMKQADISEADAFRRLQKMAKQRRLSLREVTEEVITSATAADEFFSA
ncbi:MAG: response regulator [Armatimonadetes bacterium]|nr:response regulator [Armatimonadota bacterium]NIM23530.1 response regulator [Armatimonadota bacterium]NIM67396.1 response regulator [Armatimonadota bacterium]NIM75897.1 response regulator [Armatimonadota bacterium]NIN05582.1 response regulator [Armatimonadota bacterium]